MRTVEQIAVSVLQCAVTHEPDARIIGNVTALDVVRLCVPQILTCPKCGATAWCNIDCDLCLVCSGASEGL